MTHFENYFKQKSRYLEIPPQKLENLVPYRTYQWHIASILPASVSFAMVTP